MGSIFIRFTVHGQLRKKPMQCNLFKVTEIGTSQKLICDFLLLFHCNYMHICYRFLDTTIYWLKICIFTTFTHPCLI